MEVLNTFCIPYLVIHDEDPIDPELEASGSQYDPDKLREAKRVFEENQKIAGTVNLSIGKVEIIPGKFEKLCGISKSQAEKLGKPFASVEKYVNKEVEIPDELKELTRKVYE